MAVDDSAPALLPEQEVGWAMRRAREARGVSLRALARKLGYNSHTTLSAYELGATMPTDDIVGRYERALGLPADTLGSVLAAARQRKHGDEFAKRRSPQEPQAAADAASVDPLPQAPPRRRWLVGGAVAAVLAALAVTGYVLATSATEPGLLVPDGSDPKVTGCADDAQTIDAVEVYLDGAFLAGQLQLRSSARCGTSWGKFEQNPRLTDTPPLTITITAYRPADTAVRPFSIVYAGQGPYGDQLISRSQCVYAEIVLRRDGSDSVPVRTACQLGFGR